MSAGAIAVCVCVCPAIALSIALAVTQVIAEAVNLSVQGLITVSVARAISGAVAGALTLFAYYIAHRAMKGDPREVWIRNFAVAFAATGGTTFYNANLTDANFTKATLKSTDFREAILTRTCFKETQNLDRIRPGNTLLSQTNVRDLLMTGYGYKKSYINADLRGANLDGANLNYANLKVSDLSEATLKAANLEKANLTEVSAIKTDFTRCSLTGACLEAWNIDNTTILDNVDCQYVFLLENDNQYGHRERRPHDPDTMFQPGDFEKLYTKIMNTVQLLLRNGVNPEAFKVSFQNIMSENPDISIQGFDKKGNDVLITIKVPENANKGEIEHQFNEVYEMRLEAAKKTALLEAEKQHSQTITEIAKLLAASNQTTIIENKAMNNSSDSSQNITNSTLTNSVANLKEISGQVTNSINQLSDNSEDGSINIKELLSQLKIAIESEENLDNDKKADALEEVKNIADAANNVEDSNLKKLAKRSTNALKGIIFAVPTATKLIEECNRLLPAIAKLFGL